MSGQGDCSRAFTMDPSNRDFRAVIFYNYDFLSGKFYQECFSNLTICFGEKSRSNSAVTKWYKEFQFGRQTLENGNRCGRSVTAVIVRFDLVNSP